MGQIDWLSSVDIKYVGMASTILKAISKLGGLEISELEPFHRLKGQQIVDGTVEGTLSQHRGLRCPWKGIALVLGTSTSLMKIYTLSCSSIM